MVSVLLFSFIFFPKIDIPRNVSSITIVDTTNGTEKTITGIAANNIVDLTKNAKKDFSIPACPLSNIVIYYNTSENEKNEKYVCISGDSCATIWDEKNSSYHISEKDNKELKQIVLDNGFVILPQ